MKTALIIYAVGCVVNVVLVLDDYEKGAKWKAFVVAALWPAVLLYAVGEALYRVLRR